jgi:hypothetical protein
VTKKGHQRALIRALQPGSDQWLNESTNWQSRLIRICFVPCTMALRWVVMRYVM